MGEKFWLEGLLGFEPRVAELKLTVDYVAYLRVRAVPRLYVLYRGICLTTDENHGKPQSEYPK